MYMISVNGVIVPGGPYMYHTDATTAAHEMKRSLPGANVIDIVDIERMGQGDDWDKIHEFD